MRASTLGSVHGTIRPEVGPGDEAEANSAQAAFLQIVFTLMLMFLLAFALWVVKSKQELVQANERVKAEVARREQIEQTDAGKAYVAIERHKLEMAIKELEREEEQALALDFFVNQKGEVTDDVILSLVDSGPQSNRLGAARFISGCEVAQAHYRSKKRRDALQSEWYTEAIRRSGVLEYLQDAGTSTQELTPETAEFLKKRIEETVSGLNSRTRAMHEGARLKLLRHFEDFPEKVSDKIVDIRLAEYSKLIEASLDEDTSDKPSEAEVSSAFNAYVSALEEFVYAHFAKAGAPLLKSE